MMTVGELRKLIEGVPDEFSLRATGIEGPKVAPVSGASSPEDNEFVLYLEAARPGKYREIGTYVVDK